MSGGTTIATVDGAFGTGNVSITGSNVTLTLQHGAVNKKNRPSSIDGGNDFIADSATLSIGLIGNTNDIVNLNYNGTETINMLFVNGVAQTAGMHSSADIPELMGTGTLMVLVPEPSTYILFGLGGLVALQRFRRKKS
jgi:hypothetical protein